jgi:hypothetical protein
VATKNNALMAPKRSPPSTLEHDDQPMTHPWGKMSVTSVKLMLGLT